MGLQACAVGFAWQASALTARSAALRRPPFRHRSLAKHQHNLNPTSSHVLTPVSPTKYTLFDGFAHLSSGLSCGLAGLAAGMAIGIVGDAGVRANAQQPKLFVGMILILIFAEALALYGLIGEWDGALTVLVFVAGAGCWYVVVPGLSQHSPNSSPFPRHHHHNSGHHLVIQGRRGGLGPLQTFRPPAPAALWRQLSSQMSPRGRAHPPPASSAR